VLRYCSNERPRAGHGPQAFPAYGLVFKQRHHSKTLGFQRKPEDKMLLL
jgi:hypothetical protein